MHHLGMPRLSRLLRSHFETDLSPLSPCFSVSPRLLFKLLAGSWQFTKLVKPQKRLLSVDVMLGIFLLLMMLMSSMWSSTADWITTVNTAGFQRTLSQKMTKEFLLISRGIESEVNKMRLAETISKFDSTLQDLKTGNPEGIICSICLNASEVLVSIQNVLDLWVPFQRILTENVDSIRDVDGSVDHKVLEDLSSKTEPLFKACDEVVSRLIIQAKAAHQWQHSLVEEVAFRQRTLIQRMAKSLLFLSQGVSMASNMESLGETKSVFEASHQGIIRGVPFAGVPVLTKLCTMHQLSVVTLYYQQLRPLLNRVMNSVTSSEAQQVADEVATDVVSTMEPLFDAMVGAVARQHRMCGFNVGSSIRLTGCLWMPMDSCSRPIVNEWTNQRYGIMERHGTPEPHKTIAS